MGFTVASDQEERPPIGGEKYCVAGRVRCSNDHIMEGVIIYHTKQIR